MSILTFVISAYSDVDISGVKQIFLTEITMDEAIPDLCLSALRKTFGSNLQTSDITLCGRGATGEGYSNEMLYISLKVDEQKLYLVVKIMLDFKAEEMKKSVGALYDNEIKFYQSIWPSLDAFQKSYTSCKPFDRIPKFYGSLIENRQGVLVMENLKASSFVMRSKKQLYDKTLVDVLFKHLGQLHALSFALRSKNAKEFDRLKELMTASWKDFSSLKSFQSMLTKIAEVCVSQLNQEQLKEKMKIFTEKISEEYKEATDYKGSYPVILHGDSWINNFLFKVNASGEIEDLRCLDFQLAQVGTPVYDLSYCFYSGATKPLLEDLNHFLLVYYSSLSSKLREFDCDASTIYPFRVLKEEWTKYSKFGFIMSLTIWRGKTCEVEVDMKEAESFDSPLDEVQCDEELYARVTGDLIDHMFKNGFI